MISLQDCKHGYTYRIDSRNLSIGVFNQQTKGFVGIREKFGNEFLFAEFHWDTGEPFCTVEPQEEIEKCPIEDLRESLEPICSYCRERVVHKQGKWKHAKTKTCESVAIPVENPNKPLFEYLKKLRTTNVDTTHLDA